MTTTIAQIHATGVELGQRLRTLIRGKSRSTTRRTLLGLIAALMIVTIIVFVTSLVAFTRGHGTANTVHTRTAPAILGIAAARAALLNADNAAISSLTTDARLLGPGEEFQNQIAIASQSLTRVAEDNMAGEAGSRDLQLIEGLLVTYTGLIGQADAHLRQAGNDTLGAADLWGASRLLHEQILEQLGTLLNSQKNALDAQLSTSSMTPGAVLALLLPIVALFALLMVAHIVFRRRFRRKLNPWLVLAAVLLVALSWISSRAVVAQHQLEDSRNILNSLLDEQAQTSAADIRGKKTLGKFLSGIECDTRSGCGATAERFVAEAEKPDGATGSPVNDKRLTDETRKVGGRTATATADAGLEPLVYILTILIAAAVFLGFRPRLYEYRYRPR